jgi:hypothetical protein
MMNQFGPERPVYDLTEDFRQLLIDPDLVKFLSIHNRLSALREAVDSSVHPLNWLASEMQAACCVREAKGHQGEHGMSGVVESYIDKNFRSNLEVIKQALSERASRTDREEYEKKRSLCFSYWPAQVQRAILERVKEFLKEQDIFLVGEAGIEGTVELPEGRRRLVKDVLRSAFSGAIQTASDEFYSRWLLLDVFPTIDIFKFAVRIVPRFLGMPEESLESDDFQALKSVYIQALQDLANQVREGGYRSLEYMSDLRSPRERVEFILDLHTCLIALAPDSSAAKMWSSSVNLAYDLVLKSSILADYLTILGYQPFRDSIITEEVFLEFWKSYDGPWRLYDSRLVRKLQTFLEQSRIREPDFDEQERLNLAIQVALSEEPVSKALACHFPQRPTNQGKQELEGTPQTPRTENDQNRSSHNLGPKHNLKELISSKFPKADKDDIEALTQQLNLLHRKFGLSLQYLVNLVNQAGDFKLLQGRVLEELNKACSSKGLDPAKLGIGLQLAPTEFYCLLPTEGSLKIYEVLEALEEEQRSVAVERLINLPKRKDTSSKNKGTSSKNQVIALEIREANLVVFYNFIGPNNYLVILDICPINEREKIGKRLKRRLEKSNLHQLQQSLILIDLKALLESTNQN